MTDSKKSKKSKSLRQTDLQHQPDIDPLWYKDAIIYELHIKAFQDSNDDGIGDFGGLIQRLDYLQDLGVTAIWLLPFYPSPQRDGGYDISDYYSINPNYGTVKEFKKLLKKAHERGLKVITELVLNHTSDQHPWFQRARRAKPGTPERDYYVWSDTPEKYKDTRIIFQDFETSNWTWDPVANSYFWHRFYAHQPDLNFDNLQVQEEVFKILDFWLNMGVDGFRLDAVPYLFEREGTNCENLPETHDFLKKLRKHVDENHYGKLFLAEANMWPEDSASYFGDGDECHMNYHFPIMPRLFMSLKMEDRYPITDIIDQTPAIPENCQWAMFLRNHDELTLEMVTDEERDYMYKAYNKDALSKINLGIRHRLAPLLDNNRRKIELMNYLLFSLPGTPVIYYGDEIGMGDNVHLGDRDGVRTPMQWSPDRNAGFSKTNPHKLFLPLVVDHEYNHESINVETQQNNSSSLLWWMKRVIDKRKRYKAFGRGDIKFLAPDNAKVLAFTRSYQDENILVIANLSRFSQAAALDLSEYAHYIPTEMFSRNPFPEIKQEPYVFTLGPFAYFWFILKKNDQDFDEEIDHLEPVAKLESWLALFERKHQSTLTQQILPPFFQKSSWFTGKKNTIQKIQVEDIVDFPVPNEGPVTFLTVKVSYNEGFPEHYSIPLALAGQEREESMLENCPKSILAKVLINGKAFIIYDAVFNEFFRLALLRAFLKKPKKNKLSKISIEFAPKRDRLSKITPEEEIHSSRLLSQDKGNTTISYGNAYFLKLYRKLDTTPNPDFEINQFLADKVGFPYIPKYLGSMELDKGSGHKFILGMLQENISNQGDAREYYMDVVNRFYERLLEEKGHFHPKLFCDDLFEMVPGTDIHQEALDLLGSIPMERARLIGEHTAELHLAMASLPDEKGFEPESFSLHYQRSLYSALQSMVRESFEGLRKNLDKVGEETREEFENVLKVRAEILECLKRIFSKKFETSKIRTHGDLHLGKMLFTGRDFIFIDFEGEHFRTFSEKRIKRSPIRDIASIIRSFHYVAYSSLIENGTFRQDDRLFLANMADRWHATISGIFLDAYLKKTQGSIFIPEEKDVLFVLLESFLLERAIYELKREVENNIERAIIPVRGIQSVMKRFKGEK